MEANETKELQTLPPARHNIFIIIMAEMAVFNVAGNLK